MKVLLLAGLCHNGELLREAKLKPFTGELELHVHDLLSVTATTPVKVSLLLDLLVESLGTCSISIPMSRSLAEQLCPVDRQLLILKLAQILEGDQVWLHPECCQCGETFDLGYQRSQLPISQVDEDTLTSAFQQGIAVDLEETSLQFRLPNGADQMAIAELSEDDALTQLMERILLSDSPDSYSIIASLTREHMLSIADALDNVTPQIASEIHTHCPNCSFEQSVTLDPYYMKGLSEDYLLQEVHCLAMHYHWSEAAIMSLPRQRRRQYIHLINESGGYYE